MCGDLQHAVGRGVDDERAGFLVLSAVVPDDLRPGVWFVAENFAPERRFELCDDRGREAVGIGRHRIAAHDARHLPVPDGRVLAA